MDTQGSGLYKRQRGLKLKVPHSVVVIGLGGVGSWVAWGFSMSGAYKLTFVDHDTLSESNLNRTPYCKRHIGLPKVQGMSDLITERRDMEIVPIAERVENVPSEYFNDADLVVDCRDTTSPLPDNLKEKVKIIGGYNGNSITIHLNPNPESVWGIGGQGYTSTPSSLLPAWTIGLVIVNYILACPNRKKEYIKTFTVNQLMTTMLGIKKDEWGADDVVEEAAETTEDIITEINEEREAE